MSPFVIDPDVFAPKYGYSQDQNPWTGNRINFHLDTDLKRGFKTAVNNNQLRLAMEYMSYMIDIIEGFDVKGESEVPVETEASTAKSRKISKGNSPQPVENDKEEAAAE